MIKKIHIQSLDPAERDWEYDGDGNRIYKVKMGYGTKTLYKDEYEEWKKRFGGDWHDLPDYKNKKDDENDLPYYVDLP